MSTVCIPISICNEIEKVARHFIWGSMLESRKLALVPWSECYRPIEHGGLGIRILVVQNKIFLIKLGSQVLNKTHALWVQLITSKYKLHGMMSTTIARSDCSYISRSLAKVWSDVLENVYWPLSDGCLINFWNDVWVHQVGKLRDFFQGNGNPVDTLRVRDMVTIRGDWDWFWLRSFLPDNVVSLITSMVPPSVDMGNDRLAWK